MAKILIVEDDRPLADEIRSWLEMEHYTCEWTDDGAVAVEYIKRSLIDMVILDWQLPGISGIDVLRTVTNANEEGALPILMLTGKTTTSDKICGLDNGADDYLTKPFSGEILLAKVRALLRRGYAQSLPTFSFADIILTESSHEARVNNSRMKLTGAEFACLRYLISQSEAAPVTVEALMQRAWEGSERATVDGVHVCISTIRNKLRDAGSRATIAMRHGYGYHMQSEAETD